MCSHVLSIPLQSNQNRDVLTWKENNSQTFLIKSAYQVAIRLKEQLELNIPQLAGIELIVRKSGS